MGYKKKQEQLTPLTIMRAISRPNHSAIIPVELDNVNMETY